MSIVKNAPEMNIVNQINAALNDVRGTLVKMTQMPDEAYLFSEQAEYQLGLAIQMINEHQRGKSIAWSDRKPQVEEEFS